jgi:hypothetical protein
MICALIAGRLVGAPEVRQTSEGHALVIATIRARVGKNTNELWQLQARDRPAQATLMRLGSGDAIAVQGVPNSRDPNVSGELAVQHVLYVEHVLPLQPEGAIDASLS